MYTSQTYHQIMAATSWKTFSQKLVNQIWWGASHESVKLVPNLLSSKCA